MVPISPLASARGLPIIVEISRAVHESGAFFYCDGANFNAIVGRVRPGDLGGGRMPARCRLVTHCHAAWQSLDESALSMHIDLHENDTEH